jgi:thioredoxin 1
MTSPHITDVNEANFEAEVMKADKLVLIDFWAPWCGPCRALAPVLEQFAAENADKVKVVKINVDENENLAKAFSVRSIPTLITMKDGVAVYGASGALPKQGLEQLVEESLKNPNGPSNTPANKGPQI